MCCALACCCVGDASDENYENLLHKGRRSCTDCSFLILFLIFCGGLGSIAWYAVDNGDPYRIVFGSDSFGNTCGRNNGPIWIRSNKSGSREQFEFSGQNMTERRFMFPLNASRALDTIWACVRSCPEDTVTTYEGIKKLAIEQNNSLCVDYDSAIDAAKHKPRFGVCPRLPVLRSTDLMNRCIPEDLIAFGKDLLRKVADMDWIRSYLHDLIDASPYLLQMCLVALVLALLSVALLRFFAAAIVYFVYLAVAVLAIGFSGSVWYAFWKVYKKSIQSDQDALKDTDITITTTTTMRPKSEPQHLTTAVLFKDIDFEAMINFENTTTVTLLAMALGATIISVFIVAVVWCVLPRGKKMIRLFKGASRFVGFIWVSEFLMACQRLFIAGAVSMYYFDVLSMSRRFASPTPRSPVMCSLWNLVRYHLGSAALGAFIITLLWTSLSHPWFPLVILFICSYQIANCFLSVYEMTIDTIMLCCAEELVLLRDNPEAVQQFRDFMDGTAEVMAQRNVQLIGCTRIEETYPLNTIDDERK
ncbi:hypothetical protein ANCCEY_11103 [Ancylostoma ceylanicum]|uniref:Choline transporter-like protein n=1 Tax=Ancylostoma ceylanicum TaxID=53326 RepID=A0A0D6LF68_9BILA|nr:hypothetical protein ANCCEY_11103 [Ancylostoma ceylanicum]